MPLKKRANSKRVENDDAASAPPAPAFEVAGPALNPVPALPLADALLFGDPLPQVLHILAHDSDRWKEAIVLATPFWAPMYGCLNQPIDLCVGVPSLTAASIRFDPDRELKVGSFAPQSLSENTKSLLAIARRVMLSARIPLSSYRHLIQLMPNLTAIHFGDDYVLATTSAVESLAGIEELTVDISPNIADLSEIAQLKSLRKLRLDGCTALTDISAIPSLTKLEEVSLGCCTHLTDVRPLGELMSLRHHNSTRDTWEFDEETPAERVPSELLHTYAALLRSSNEKEVEHGEVMLRKIVSVDRDPCNYDEESSAEDVPVDLLDVYLKMLRSDNMDCIDHGARMLRVLLPNPDFPLNPVVDTGCLSYLSSFMLRDDIASLRNDSLFNAVEASSEEDSHSAILSTPNLVENIIRLLEVPGCEVSTGIAIGNLCSGVVGRDRLLELGVLNPLLDAILRILDGEGDPEPMAVSTYAWTIYCVCRGSPAPNVDVARICPALVEFLVHDDTDVISYGAQAVAELTNASTEHIQCILDCGCLDPIIELLEVDTVALHAVRTIRNIFRGSEPQMQAVIDGGALEKFPLMLANAGEDIQRITCEAVLAIIQRSDGNLRTVAEADVLPALLGAIKGSGKAVQKPAMSVINHTTTRGSQALVDSLVASDVIAFLGEIMKQRDAETLPLAKESMEAIMNTLHAA